MQNILLKVAKKKKKVRISSLKTTPKRLILQNYRSNSKVLINIQSNCFTTYKRLLEKPLFFFIFHCDFLHNSSNLCSYSKKKKKITVWAVGRDSPFCHTTPFPSPALWTNFLMILLTKVNWEGRCSKLFNVNSIPHSINTGCIWAEMKSKYILYPSQYFSSHWNYY